MHEHHAVGNFKRLFLVVGDEEGGQRHFVVQPPQPAAQFLAHLGVERAEGFVQQQHPGLHSQRSRQCNALALAAAELVRVAIRKAFQLHQFQQMHDPASYLGLHRPRGLRPHTQPERHVLEHAHVAEQCVVLEDEADVAFAHVGVCGVHAVEQHAATVGQLQPRNDAQQ